MKYLKSEYGEMRLICRWMHILFLSLVLSGCLVTPPHESLQRSCGPYPENFEAIIIAYLKQDLKFPESIRDFEVLKAPEVVVLDTRYPDIRLHKGFDVWECFIVFDVKGDDGIYVGKDLHVVWIRHNRLVAFDYKGLDMAYRFKERIKNTGY